MQKRRWPKDVVMAALFCVALVLVAVAWHAASRGAAGYNALRVGMSAREADAVMERHGYRLAGGDGNLVGRL